MNGSKDTRSANIEIAIVLAGGRSTRMGRDKALLPLENGRTFLQHQVERLSTLTPAVWVSGPYPELGGFVDSFPNAGPLGGMAEAAERAPAGARLLFVPVDMPFLPLESLRRLLVDTAPASYYLEHELPAVFCNDERWRANLWARARATANRERSVRALLAAIPGARALSLPKDEAAAFANLNSPAELNARRLAPEA